MYFLIVLISISAPWLLVRIKRRFRSCFEVGNPLSVAPFHQAMRLEPLEALPLAVFHGKIPIKKTQSGQNAGEGEKVGKTIMFARRMSIQMRAGASRNRSMAMSFLWRDQNEAVSSQCR